MAQLEIAREANKSRCLYKENTTKFAREAERLIGMLRRCGMTAEDARKTSGLASIASLFYNLANAKIQLEPRSPRLDFQSKE